MCLVRTKWERGPHIWHSQLSQHLYLRIVWIECEHCEANVKPMEGKLSSNILNDINMQYVWGQHMSGDPNSMHDNVFGSEYSLLCGHHWSRRQIRWETRTKLIKFELIFTYMTFIYYYGSHESDRHLIKTDLFYLYCDIAPKMWLRFAHCWPSDAVKQWCPNTTCTQHSTMLIAWDKRIPGDHTSNTSPLSLVCRNRYLALRRRTSIL